MKKTICFLVLFTSIAPGLCAQSNNKADKAFEVPENIIFTRRFMVQLNKENRMQIELSDIADLDRLANIDSLLQQFLEDIAAIKDSLSDALTAKRIDYVTDVQGRKKIRFQQFQQKGTSYLIDKGQLALLKTQQDTINIIGIIINPPKAKQKISLINPRYYRILFYLNNITDLTAYMNGMLKEKIATIQNNINGKWPVVLGSGFHYIKKDPGITADKPKGFTLNGTGDFLSGNLSVNVQNYKNYFVPSFSVGIKVTFTNRDRTFKWEPGLSWEPHFLFARNDQNNLHTYRNDFLMLTYGQGGTRDHDPRKDFAYSAVFSLGYLINRNGDYFDKNTFRLGAGKIQFYKTNIEPVVYFNNFFKGVTPGIRISQYF
jgi:hypothetical protein